jgi:hypothetical protein
MNYWSAFSTNLDVTDSLWNYMEQNWQPRGEYTARVLYNISRGWVRSVVSSLRVLNLMHSQATHDEMNVGSSRCCLKRKSHQLL